MKKANKDKIISEYMREIGRKGGKAKSPEKAAASKANAKKGGWPLGKPRKKKGKLESKNIVDRG